jgi:hypothetical protein
MIDGALHALPRFPVLRDALRRTTERLALEVHAPRAETPDWSELDWSVARAVSAMQGITVLLANRLQWSGPPSWQAFLTTQRELALQRDARIESLLGRVGVGMRDGGVACIALKGSALRQLGVYAPGERPMGDIDLLVQPADAARVARVMHGIDYTQAFESRRHVVYAPRTGAPAAKFGEHPDNVLKIEVHTKVAEALPVAEVNISAGWLDGGARPGLNVYRAIDELMHHLLLHAAGNMRAHAIRQIQLHDIALLAPKLRVVDWRRLLETAESRGGSWWMLPPLALTERYYPGIAGRSLLAEFAARCPPLLRNRAVRATLAQVSWSNLRIAAFPGIYWSRSPREALLFARSRIFPSRVALRELQIAETAQPALQTVGWYGIPHFRRILRWTFARAPRAQTVASLHAALAAGEAQLNA